MSKIQYIDKDFVKFRYEDEKGAKRQATLVFGDKVKVLEKRGRWTKVRALEFWDGEREGTVTGEPFRTREKGVLKFSMVDVQQGDGMIIETPPDENHENKIVFIDGGENQLFARHAAARFFHRKSSKKNPLKVDLILITHGDADHFDGLNDIKKSETTRGLAARKRLFIHPKRIYHNGLVKAPGKVAEDKRLGRTVPFNQDLAIVALFDDPAEAPACMRNMPFNRWLETVKHWQQRGNIEFRRIAFGMNSQELFGFLEDIQVNIQGPFTVPVADPQDGQCKPALPFLHQPPKSSVLHLEDGDTPGTSRSVSHTINGHSIALRLTYGNVRFNLTGDLNQESMQLMEKNLDDLSELEAEIVKAPHHGSADFDFSALKHMRPVVSLISSGDEHAGKEHIHPRATLVSALGRVSRKKTGILLCTELVAFFSKKDYSHKRKDIAEFLKVENLKNFVKVDKCNRVDITELRTFFNKTRRSSEEEKALSSFFGFERTNFGIIHIRTDGERVLVFTHSGKKGMREAYRFRVDSKHQIEFAKDVESA